MCASVTSFIVTNDDNTYDYGDLSETIEDDAENPHQQKLVAFWWHSLFTRFTWRQTFPLGPTPLQSHLHIFLPYDAIILRGTCSTPYIPTINVTIPKMSIYPTAICIIILYWVFHPSQEANNIPFSEWSKAVFKGEECQAFLCCGERIWDEGLLQKLSLRWQWNLNIMKHKNRPG
jgi:hypothetical protein